MVRIVLPAALFIVQVLAEGVPGGKKGTCAVSDNMCWFYVPDAGNFQDMPCGDVCPKDYTYCYEDYGLNGATYFKCTPD